MTNTQQLRLELAPDAAARNTFYVRQAEPGDECCYCDVPFKPGEWIDKLFVVHLKCYDENIDGPPNYGGKSNGA